MAAIERVGNVIIIAAAGTLNEPNLHIMSMRLYGNDSSAELIVGELSTGMTILRYRNTIYASSGATPTDPPFYASIDMAGSYGQLSFNTVTACTAWISKR